MIIKKLSDIKNTDREVHCPRNGFTSYRYLLEKDNMGFSLTRTTVHTSGEHLWHYRDHLEACFCIKGQGVITNLKTNERFEVTENTMYALDKNDAHLFEAYEEVILICVFNPPLKGREIHKKDGSY